MTVRVFSAVESWGFLWRHGVDGMLGVNHHASRRPRRQEREPEFLETGAFYVMDAAGFRVARHRFFGRGTISFVVVLPIALPGIVTGIALNSAFGTVLKPLGLGLGLFTVIVGHATFCIVVVFNNVVARLRRTSGSYEEAAMDLGADTFRAFVDVTFPLVRSALLAGGLLAFALSFDEIVVTTFTAGPGIETLPIWIFDNMTRPQQAPVVNVVAAVLVLLSVLPIYVAQRLSADTATGSRV